MEVNRALSVSIRSGFIDGGDVKLRFIEAGDGRPVLLLHGLTERAETWIPLIKRLAREGYKAIAIDFRGHGESSRPARPPTLSDYARDVESAIYALGLGRLLAVGFSLGGFALLKHLEKYPHGAERIVLLASAHRVGNPAGMRRRAMLARNEGMDSVAREVARLFGDDKKDVFKRFVEPRLLSLDSSVYASTVESLAGADLSEALKAVDAEVLIIAGEHDFLVPPDVALEAENLNPGAKVKVLRCKGHMIRVESPNVDEDVLRFLVGL